MRGLKQLDTTERCWSDFHFHFSLTVSGAVNLWSSACLCFSGAFGMNGFSSGWSLPRLYTGVLWGQTNLTEASLHLQNWFISILPRGTPWICKASLHRIRMLLFAGHLSSCYFCFQLSFETRGDENKSIFTEWKNKINRSQNYFCNLSGKNCEQYHEGINNLTVSVLTPWRDLMISEIGALLIYRVCCEFHMRKVKRSTTDLVSIMWHWFYKGPQVSSLWSSVYWLPLWAEEKLQHIQQKLSRHCKSKQNCSVGTSLAVQWLRLHLPMLGAWVRSLPGELRSHMPLGAAENKSLHCNLHPLNLMASPCWQKACCQFVVYIWFQTTAVKWVPQ